MYMENPVTNERLLKAYPLNSNDRIWNYTNQCCSLISRQVYKKYGHYSLSYPIMADLDFFFRIKGKIEFLYTPRPISVFSLGGVSSTFSFRKIFSNIMEQIRLYKKHNKSSLFIFRNSIRVFSKNILYSFLYMILDKKSYMNFIYKKLQKKNQKF